MKRIFLITVVGVLISIHFKCSAPAVRKDIRKDIDRFELLARHYIDNEKDTLALVKAIQGEITSLLSDKDKGMIFFYTTTFPDTPAISSTIHERKFNFLEEDHVNPASLAVMGAKDSFYKSIELTKNFTLEFEVFTFTNSSNGYKYCMEAQLNKVAPITGNVVPGTYGENVIVFYKYY